MFASDLNAGYVRGSVPILSPEANRDIKIIDKAF
ncbi:hypothetical protein CNEO3_330032 [Clostridium neonatale]|nr:hypothetical protein CNEO2_1120004 [Clostridium neonatale]CAI3220624.1 hypothetical protein CNEO2_1200004 [Clostridium neonatale]CAI3574943.1 hypothetical protein CNEO2_1290004 [Clostridium neonatale]CAI3652784.1 hypothetical protein CNEO3_330032 [Clostridium neonatale]